MGDATPAEALASAFSPDPAIRPHSSLSAGSAGGTPQRPRSKSGNTTEVAADERAVRGEEILHALFSLPGLHLADDFSCAFADGLLLLHGRLYVTDRAVLFSSSIFGKETRKILPFASMVSVEKAVSGLIIPALKFTMQRRGDPSARTVLLFTSFFAGKRDKAYELVARLQQAAARRNGGGGTPAVVALTASSEASMSGSRLGSNDSTSSGGGGGGASASAEDGGYSAPTLSVTPSQLLGDIPSRGSSALGGSFGSSLGSYSGSGRAAEIAAASGTTGSGAVSGPATGGAAGSASAGPSAFAVAARNAGESDRSDGSLTESSSGPFQQPTAQRPVVLVGQSGVDLHAASVASRGSDSSSAASSVAAAGSRGVPPLRSPKATTITAAAAAGSTSPATASPQAAASAAAANGANGAASSVASRPRRGTESRLLPPLQPDFLQSRLGHKDAKLVLDTVLPLPPQAFFEAFLSDGATFSMADAHRARGDFAVHCGDWAPVAGSSGGSGASSGSASSGPGAAAGAAASASASASASAHARTIRLRMPLEPVPFCPRETAVEKVQQLSSYAGPSWVLETSARSFDVPYAETFLTTDCVLACPHDAKVPWLGKELPPPAEVAAAVRAHRSACAAAGARALAQPTSPTPAMTRLIVVMRVDFLKSTIFKGRIASKAEEGVAAFFALFLDKARAHAASHVVPRLLAEQSGGDADSDLDATVAGQGAGLASATPPAIAITAEMAAAAHARGGIATSSYLSPTMAAAMANPLLALPIEPIMAAYPTPAAAAALIGSGQQGDRDALVRSYSQLYAAHAAAVNQLRRLQSGGDAASGEAAAFDSSIGALHAEGRSNAGAGDAAGIVSARGKAGGASRVQAVQAVVATLLRYAKAHPIALLALLMAVVAMCVSSWSAVQATAAVDAQAAAAASAASSSFASGDSGAGTVEVGSAELQQLEARVMARLLAEMRSQTGTVASPADGAAP